MASAGGGVFKTVFLNPISAVGMTKSTVKSHKAFWSLQDIHAEMRRRGGHLKPLPKTAEESFLALALGQVVSIAAGEAVGDLVEGLGVGERVVEGAASLFARQVDEVAGKLAGDVAENSVYNYTEGSVVVNKRKGKNGQVLADQQAVSASSSGLAENTAQSQDGEEPKKHIRSPILGFMRRPNAGLQYATDHLSGHWEGVATNYSCSSSPANSLNGNSTSINGHAPRSSSPIFSKQSSTLPSASPTPLLIPAAVPPAGLISPSTPTYASGHPSSSSSLLSPHIQKLSVQHSADPSHAFYVINPVINPAPAVPSEPIMPSLVPATTRAAPSKFGTSPLLSVPAHPMTPDLVPVPTSSPTGRRKSLGDKMESTPSPVPTSSAGRIGAFSSSIEAVSAGVRAAMASSPLKRKVTGEGGEGATMTHHPVTASFEAVKAAVLFKRGEDHAAAHSGSSHVASASERLPLPTSPSLKYTLDFDLSFIGEQVLGVGKVYGTLISGTVNPAGTEIRLVESDGLTDVTYRGVAAGGVIRGDWWTSRVDGEEVGEGGLEISKEMEAAVEGGRVCRGSFVVRHL
ncbi:hypothetical protein HDU67_007579 [Dinochytrium kinnereticum]|nr:hypothetical protein HDU67_007579 [Dinochytrium kinnereticum]